MFRFSSVFIAAFFFTFNLQAEPKPKMETKSFTFSTIADSNYNLVPISIQKFDPDVDGELEKVTVSGVFSGTATGVLNGFFQPRGLPARVGVTASVHVFPTQFTSPYLGGIKLYEEDFSTNITTIGDGTFSQQSVSIPIPVFHAPSIEVSKSNFEGQGTFDTGIRTLVLLEGSGGNIAFTSDRNGNLSGEVTITYHFFPPPKKCKVSEIAGSSVPFSFQTNLLWRNDAYARNDLSVTPNKTMGALGCTTTATTMLLNFYGINRTIDGSPLTPQTANSTDYKEYQTSKGLTRSVYNTNNDVTWSSVAEYGRTAFRTNCERDGGDPQFCASASSSAISYQQSLSGEAGEELAEEEICKGNPVILAVNRSNGRPGKHFVVATGVEVDKNGRTFTVNDPGRADGFRITLEQSIQEVQVFRRTPGSSMVVVESSKNVDFILTDSSGKKGGDDPRTGQSFREIPGMRKGIGRIGSIQPETPAIATESTRYLYHLQDATSGAYTIEVIPITPGEPYHIKVHGYDSNGDSNQLISEEGVLNAGETLTINLDHSVTPLPDPGPEEVNAELKRTRGSVFRGYRTRAASFFIRGQLKPNDINVEKLNLDEGLEFSINDHEFKLSPGEFKVRGRSRKRIFVRKDGIIFYINDRGRFIFSGRSEGVFKSVRDNGFEFSLKVDSIKGKKDFELQCRRTHCRGR